MITTVSSGVNVLSSICLVYYNISQQAEFIHLSKNVSFLRKLNSTFKSDVKPNGFFSFVRTRSVQQGRIAHQFDHSLRQSVLFTILKFFSSEEFYPFCSILG